LLTSAARVLRSSMSISVRHSVVSADAEIAGDEQQAFAAPDAGRQRPGWRFASRPKVVISGLVSG
jgi:hypothetical protein